MVWSVRPERGGRAEFATENISRFSHVTDFDVTQNHWCFSLCRFYGNLWARDMASSEREYYFVRIEKDDLWRLSTQLYVATSLKSLSRIVSGQFLPNTTAHRSHSPKSSTRMEYERWRNGGMMERANNWMKRSRERFLGLMESLEFEHLTEELLLLFLKLHCGLNSISIKVWNAGKVN